jgi:prephenate dehydrogenase
MGVAVPRPPFALARVVGGEALGVALGLALRARGVAHAVDLVTSDPEALRAAQAAGLPAAGRAGLLSGEPDAVFLAGSVAQAEVEVGEFARRAPPPLVQDLAAVKRPPLLAAARSLERHPGLLFVGAHPLLEGRTLLTPAAEMFAGVPVVLCPLEGVTPAALASAERVWRLLGAEPVVLSAEEHDRCLALTAQLPWLAAALLAEMAAAALAPASPEEQFVGPRFLRATAAAVDGEREREREALVRNADCIAPLARRLARSLDELADVLEQATDDGMARAFSRCAAAAAFRRRFAAD